MRALIDTHVLLWWLRDDPRLSSRVHALVGDGGNELLWSAASSWELAIKVRIGKIRLPSPPRQYIPQKLREQNLVSLPIEQSHALQVAELPLHHRDPFDRLLVAQCQVEGLPLVTSDPFLGRYDIETVW